MSAPEASTTHLLRQVCQQYLDAQDLSLLGLASTLVCYLGDLHVMWRTAVPESPALEGQLMAALTAQVRTRLAQDVPPGFEAPPGDPMRDDDPRRPPEAQPSWALYQALQHLTAEADHAYHFGVPGGVRMVLTLLTEVLVVWAIALDQDEADLVRMLETELAPELARYIAQRLSP